MVSWTQALRVASCVALSFFVVGKVDFFMVVCLRVVVFVCVYVWLIFSRSFFRSFLGGSNLTLTPPLPSLSLPPTPSAAPLLQSLP